MEFENRSANVLMIIIITCHLFLNLFSWKYLNFELKFYVVIESKIN